MRFNTISVMAVNPELEIKKLSVYYGTMSDYNLILCIKDVENMSSFEKDMLIELERIEEVEEFVLFGEELKVAIK